MLSGRISELEYLNQNYDQRESRILIIYGQKHIGKTALTKEFVEDKPSYYYLAKPCSEREQKYQWGLQLKSEGLGDEAFPDYYDILHSLCNSGGSKKVIIIDEFHNIVKASETFMQELLRFLHSEEKKCNVLVLLCSSLVGWVENSMVTKIGDAAYELSGLLKLRELSFLDIVHRFPNFRIEECVEAYAILGGIPGLWNQFDDRLTIRQNICQKVLNPDSYLFDEGQRIVADQLRETSVYNTILASIAAGNRKLNDMYLHTEFSRAKISVYLKNLIELELVEKVFSYDAAEKDSVQKGVYRIINPFVDFYFTYMYPNMSALHTLPPDEYYSRYINTGFRKYVAGYFKLVCRQHLEKLNGRGRLPFRFERSGEWVGKDGTIDMIAQDEEGRTLVALCNWEKQMMTYEDYEWVLSCARKAKINVDYIYLYTAAGFDEKLSLEAKVKRNLKLIRISDM